MSGNQPNCPYDELARRALNRHVRRRCGQAAPARPAVPAWPALLDAAIDRLPAKSKAALVACDLEDRSPREAATLLGWSRRKVCTRLLLGRRLLLRRLERQGVTLSAGCLRRVLKEEARSGGLSDAARRRTVMLATGAEAGWSSRLADLVRVALQTVDQWIAE